VPSRQYSIVVEGELSDSAAVAFDGMSLTREGGNTVLSGAVRDQAELLALLLRASDLGLTLLSARDDAYRSAPTPDSPR
jgi:hypothetical protein